MRRAGPLVAVASGALRWGVTRETTTMIRTHDHRRLHCACVGIEDSGRASRRSGRRTLLRVNRCGDWAADRHVAWQRFGRDHRRWHRLEQRLSRRGARHRVGLPGEHLLLRRWRPSAP